MHACPRVVTAGPAPLRRACAALMLFGAAALAAAAPTQVATAPRYAVSGASAQRWPDAGPADARYRIHATAHLEPFQASVDRRYAVRGAAAKGFDACVDSAIFKDGFESP